MQIDPVQLSPNQLVAELNRLDVYFLQDETAPVMTAPMPPATLIMQLATSDEARLRLALIPLLLRHPEFADDVCWVVPQIQPAAQLILQCYYTAAHLLQQKYWARLHTLFGAFKPLPDLFITALGVPTFSTPEQGLQMLAERQRILSGRAINWLGTYEHGTLRLLTHEERRQVWQKSSLVKSSLY